MLREPGSEMLPKEDNEHEKGGLSLAGAVGREHVKKSGGQKCVFLNNFHLIRNVFWIYIYLQ